MLSGDPDELPGLVAQGRTVAEIDARRERDGAPVLPGIAEHQDYAIIAGT
jgi:hypothetical protein